MCQLPGRRRRRPRARQRWPSSGGAPPPALSLSSPRACHYHCPLPVPVPVRMPSNAECCSQRSVRRDGVRRHATATAPARALDAPPSGPHVSPLATAARPLASGAERCAVTGTYRILSPTYLSHPNFASCMTPLPSEMLNRRTWGTRYATYGLASPTAHPLVPRRVSSLRPRGRPDT